jgi:threonine/homoserine/homoserine lactone efflux protein
MISNNLAADFGVLADTIEVIIAAVMIVGGLYLTYAVQKWADRAGEPPPADNQGLSGAAQQYEPNTLRG